MGIEALAFFFAKRKRINLTKRRRVKAYILLSLVRRNFDSFLYIRRRFPGFFSLRNGSEEVVLIKSGASVFQRF